MLSRSLFVVVALFATAAGAEDPPAAAAPPSTPVAVPTADEIKRVTTYYTKGHDQGPILLDLVLCAKVEKNAETKKNECVGELGPTLKKGDPFSAYIKLMVPMGPKFEDVKIKFLRDGEVSSASEYTVEANWAGYSVFKTITSNKAGTWEVQVLWGTTVLGSKKIKVE